MPRQRTPAGWILFVLTACSKSMLDVSRFHKDGKFDSIFYSQGLFYSHPVWCCVNIAIDIGALLGAVMVIQEAIFARRRGIDR